MFKVLKRAAVTVVAVILGMWVADSFLIYETNDKGERIEGSRGFIARTAGIGLDEVVTGLVIYGLLVLAEKFGLLD